MINYPKKLIWTKILNTIAKTAKNKIKIVFHQKNDLLYFENEYFLNFFIQRRLCFLQIVLKKTFQTTHKNNHLKFHKCYKILSFVYYIRDLIFALKIYLKHCLKYQINQIKGHKSYKALQLIELSSIFFYIVIMNFILTLSKIKKIQLCHVNNL